MAEVQIGSLTLLLERKAIKNLHISVMPPDGRIRVAAPQHMTDTAIRMALVSRIPWIRKQQKAFIDQPRQPAREFISGESHYLWGRRYRLDLVERSGRHEVQVAGGKIRMFVNPGTTVDNRELLLNETYRQLLKERVSQLLPQWSRTLKTSGVEWGVKRMKTKWGSCNIQAQRIWLNLELAKKPPECLEYILVHELVHLKERHHNDRFMALMDRAMPAWRERRNLLNRLPLAHEAWDY